MVMDAMVRPQRPRVGHGFIIAGIVWLLLATAPIATAQHDAWPFAGRTPNRLSRCDTIGPQTATLAWRIRYRTDGDHASLRGSPVMDAAERIFLGTPHGVVAIDTRTRQRAWEFAAGHNVYFGPAVWRGRVFWGETNQGALFRCAYAGTGEIAWTFQRIGSLGEPPVTDPNGVVYIVDGGSSHNDSALCARRISDGSEVWTRTVIDSGEVPSLDYPTLISLTAGPPHYSAFDPQNSVPLWTQLWIGHTDGLAAIENGRIYIPSGYDVFCLDEATGHILWRFDLERICTRGGVAIGHDGTIYCGTGGGGGQGVMFAITPDGHERWRYEANQGDVAAPPMVGGDDTIYFTTEFFGGSTYKGGLQALRPDGTPLWSYVFPDGAWASPILGPDGTLYVTCDDMYLYAFHDPLRGDLNCDSWVNFDDINPFVQLLSDPAGWQAAYPDCPMSNGDCNGDGRVDFDDINVFVALLSGL